MLSKLAELIHTRNEIDKEIAALINRPAQQGHIGEFIAARIFAIDLHESATHKGSDGFFTEGMLSGRSVNVKYYAKRENILDINPDGIPDYYLVLAGPKTKETSSRGGTRPMVIDSVFLFDSAELLPRLRAKIGVATSVPQKHWEEAKIFPKQNESLMLSEEQKQLLSLFRSE